MFLALLRLVKEMIPCYGVQLPANEHENSPDPEH